MDIHESIKSAREGKGLSQSQVAEAIGIAYQNYWKIENGKTELSVSRLYQIADVLDVPVRELLGIEPPIDTLLLDRMKELEKEVGYLKKILEATEREATYTKRMALFAIQEKLDEASNELDLGKYIITDNATGESFEVKGENWANIVDLPNGEEVISKIDAKEYTCDLVFTEDENEMIRQKAIEDDFEFFKLMQDLGFIADGYLNVQINRYRDNRINEILAQKR